MSELQPEDLIDTQHQLQARLWAGEYYEQGQPIIRLLGDLSLTMFRRAAGQSDD